MRGRQQQLVRCGAVLPSNGLTVVRRCGSCD